ncbi:MAG: hypothetical protein OXC02_06390 [Rhodobacteraceae bacterium]|nr:hypothetical protein [Paracoccaceae bacterium]
MNTFTVSFAQTIAGRWLATVMVRLVEAMLILREAAFKSAYLIFKSAYSPKSRSYFSVSSEICFCDWVNASCKAALERRSHMF